MSKFFAALLITLERLYNI